MHVDTVFSVHYTDLYTNDSFTLHCADFEAPTLHRKLKLLTENLENRVNQDCNNLAVKFCIYKSKTIGQNPTHKLLNASQKIEKSQQKR